MRKLSNIMNTAKTVKNFLDVNEQVESFIATIKKEYETSKMR